MPMQLRARVAKIETVAPQKTKKSVGKRKEKSKTREPSNKHKTKSKSKPKVVSEKSVKKPNKSQDRKRSVSIKEKSQPKQKKRPAPKKRATKQVVQKGFMSEAQKKEYNQLKEDLNKLGVSKLKQALQANNQPKTGSKPELIERVADGKQFGKIPACSSCGGGKLRFNRANGTYKCPGYMEDTDFVHCSKTYQFKEIERQKWVE